MKKSLIRSVIATLVPISFVGCGSTLPLVFTDKTTLGLEASGGGEGAPEITLGFKTTSVAVIPVAVRKKNQDGGVAEVIPLRAVSADNSKDAYSTFGNFTTNSGVETTTASVGLGRFFATGIAAQKIAEKMGEALVKKAEK
ncbi:MAG: hypothetical protein V1706_16445 [Pseudomonadota bacterium]